jgi:hypothetical protein
MSLTEINIDDLNQLKRFRLERLLHFFTTSLPLCLIQVDVSNSKLAVYCPHAKIVDNLLDDFEDLCNHAWLILGVREIALYFCQEEILHINIHSHQ